MNLLKKHCRNIGYVFFEIPIMHRWLLRKEKWRLYWQDVGVPLVACRYWSNARERICVPAQDVALFSCDFSFSTWMDLEAQDV